MKEYNNRHNKQLVNDGFTLEDYDLSKKLCVSCVKYKKIRCLKCYFNNELANKLKVG